MSLVGFQARNHPQQVAADGVDDRMLPDDAFDGFNRRFRFTIDVAASHANHRLMRYYTKEENGLAYSWARERVYCNPPFSAIRPWVQKAWSENEAEIIVMLLPANRTEQGWWQDWIELERDNDGSPLRVEFLPGRQRFMKPGQLSIGPNERPPFGICLCIWNWAAHIRSAGGPESVTTK
jgi:phage N-6-adenine-methyltransferase